MDTEHEGSGLEHLFQQGADQADSPKETSSSPSWANGEPVGQAGPTDNGSDTQQVFAEVHTKRKGQRGFGGEGDDPDLQGVFTPENVGKLFADGYSALMKAIGSAPLSETEHKNMCKSAAYYMRARAPKKSRKWQPEILFGLTILMPLVARPEVVNVVAEKTTPLLVRAAQWTWRVVSFPFRAKPKADA